LLFVTLMIGAFSVDAALYFYVHKGQQNAADAAALGAASELFRNSSATLSVRKAAAVSAAQNLSVQNRGNNLANADVTFGYVEPVTGVYNAATFTTPTNNTVFSTTGGFNAVRVTVKAGSGQANTPVPAIFAKYLGFNSFTSEAQAVAVYGGGVTTITGGVRPALSV
jgi:uncharacterized membrane protein